MREPALALLVAMAALMPASVVAQQAPSLPEEFSRLARQSPCFQPEGIHSSCDTPQLSIQNALEILDMYSWAFNPLSGEFRASHCTLRAFVTILVSDNPTRDFHRLLQSERGGARLFGLAGLWLVNPPLFDRLYEASMEDETPVCLRKHRPRDASVGEFVRYLKAGKVSRYLANAFYEEDDWDALLDALCDAAAAGMQLSNVATEEQITQAVWELLLLRATSQVTRGDKTAARASAECALSIANNAPAFNGATCAHLRLDWVNTQEQAGGLLTIEALERARALTDEAGACDPGNPDVPLYAEELDRLITEARAREK